MVSRHLASQTLEMILEDYVQTPTRKDEYTIKVHYSIAFTLNLAHLIHSLPACPKIKYSDARYQSPAHLFPSPFKQHP